MTSIAPPVKSSLTYSKKKIQELLTKLINRLTHIDLPNLSNTFYSFCNNQQLTLGETYEKNLFPMFFNVHEVLILALHPQEHNLCSTFLIETDEELQYISERSFDVA